MSDPFDVRKLNGQVAYEAWRTACAHTGVNTPEWDKLLQDEQYQWEEVYETLKKTINKNE